MKDKEQEIESIDIETLKEHKGNIERKDKVNKIIIGDIHICLTGNF